MPQLPRRPTARAASSDIEKEIPLNIRLFLTATLVAAIATPAMAAPALTLYPVHIGAETARFDRGAATLSLQTPTGTVEVRPMPVEKGKLAFSVAVFNQSKVPAHFGTENIGATINAIPVAVPTRDQLADQARKKARGAKIGTVLATGVLAGAASTASSSGTYYHYVAGPRHGYAQAIHWEDNTPGVIGATASIAGGAMMVQSIDQKLDYTLDQLGTRILQTTTVDPGSSFGGLVIVPTGKGLAYPAEVGLQIAFGGKVYPFAFRLTPAGTNVPPPLPAAAQPGQPMVPSAARQ